MKFKHFITAVLLMAAINLTPALVHAQAFDNGDPDAEGGGSTNVPIDDGVSLLIAAGIAYGIKKKYDHNKQMAAHKYSLQ